MLKIFSIAVRASRDQSLVTRSVRRFRDLVPPFAPRGPSGWFPRFAGTMRVLRHPEPIPPRFVSFAWRYRGCTRFFAPTGYGYTRPGAWTFGLPEPSRDFYRGDLRALPGSWANPGAYMPWADIPGDPPAPCPNGEDRWCLPLVPQRRLPNLPLSRLITTACTLAVYASWPRLPVYVTVARVRRTTTQDSLPVWRPPPFTVGTSTRGSRLKVSGATSFLFVQDYPGAM